MGGGRKQCGDVELWQVQTLLAGYHRLRVLMGVGCLQARKPSKPSKPSPRSRPDSDLTQVWHGKQMETASFHTVIRDHRSSIGGCPLIHSSDDVDREANPVDLCDDISGSPSQLLCSPAQTGSPMFEYCDWGISQKRFQDLLDLLTLSQCFSMFLTSWFSWCFMMFLSVSPFGAFAFSPSLRIFPVGLPALQVWRARVESGGSLWERHDLRNALHLRGSQWRHADVEQTKSKWIMYRSNMI